MQLLRGSDKSDRSVSLTTPKRPPEVLRIEADGIGGGKS